VPIVVSCRRLWSSTERYRTLTCTVLYSTCENLLGGLVSVQSNASAEVSQSERRRQAIIKAAIEVFLQHGYVGATTDEIASTASVSKQTLYKHFADKEHLFAEIILDTTVQLVDGLSDAVADTLHDAEDVRAALRGLADGFMRGLLQPDVLRLRRLVIAEAERFPELGKAWFDRGFDRTLVILGEAMQRLADLSDPTLAAYQFAGLVMYQPMNQVMFAGTETAPAKKTLNRIADSAVEVFLARYG
jgi:TetR/AcrR family transcriptional regulator, mexJK operon transcriptional repressor